MGGSNEVSCVDDLDCEATLGPGVAVCDYDPDIRLGECIAPDWD